MPRRAGELLLDLGQVAVAVDLVRHEFSVRLTTSGLSSAAPRPAPETPDLASITTSGDQAAVGQRGEGQHRGGRIAARVGDQLGVADRVAVELGEPVDGFSSSSRLTVRPVPGS